MARKEEEGGKEEGAAAALRPAVSISSDDDDDAGELQIDAAQVDRLMALERELEATGAQYDTHVEVRSSHCRGRDKRGCVS